MKDFIINNWEYIGTGILLLAELIFFICKKRPKKELYDGSIISELLNLISEAENKFKIGKDKKEYVIAKFKEKFPKLTEELGKNSDTHISEIIEYILTIPQKKGAKNNGKETSTR